MYGPPKSTAGLENALIEVFSLDKGSGAMICSQDFPFRRLHSMHSFSHWRITSRAETIQYLVDSAARVWLVSDAWLPISWNSFTVSFVILLFRGSMTV